MQICHIKEKLKSSSKNKMVEVVVEDEDAAVGNLEVHHHIGWMENNYEDIGAFIHRQQSDPAIMVSGFH